MLEDAFTLLLINMQDLKRVPGRKTDVKDSEWLAQLLECGLLRPSFVPPPPIREVAGLDAVSGPAGPRSEPGGQSALQGPGRCGAEADNGHHERHGQKWPGHAAGAGRRDHGSGVLAELARGKLRKKLPELRRALQGRFRSHHAFLIEQIFAKIDFLDEALERLTTEIDQRLVPFEPMLTALDTIPGVDRIGAISIVAETGGDMTRFLTAGHLCSWGAMCPGQNESAGKRRSGKTRKGNRYLRGTLIQAGLGAMRKNGSALPARYHRVARHRGHKKAVVAVGHQILEIAFYIMRDGVTYEELGADYFNRRHAEKAVRRHVRQLEALGFHVTIEKAA
jgi:transposase